MSNSKKCGVCGGVVLDGHTTVTVDFGEGVVVVRNVPSLVCNQCGEDWIDDVYAEKVEQLVGNARQNHTMVEVVTMA